MITWMTVFYAGSFLAIAILINLIAREARKIREIK
jgi:hypothetical protein